MEASDKIGGNETVVMMPVERLFRGLVHETLFPGPRDWGELKEEIARNGYKQEHAIVARPFCAGESRKFEVIDGLGRVTIAREEGIATISVVVREMTDQEALMFVAEANLYGRTAVARVNLIQAIVMAKAHESAGGNYRVEPILRVCNVSEHTYTRAHSSLILVVETLREAHEDLKAKSLAEVVAEGIRGNLWGDFTQFYVGEMKVKTFWRKHYLTSERAQEESLKQNQFKSKSKTARPRKSEPDSADGADRWSEGSRDETGLLLAFMQMGTRAWFARDYTDNAGVKEYLGALPYAELQHLARYADELCEQIKRVREEKARPRAKTARKPSAELRTLPLFDSADLASTTQTVHPRPR